MPAMLLAVATIGALTTRALNELDQARNRTPLRWWESNRECLPSPAA